MKTERTVAYVPSLHPIARSMIWEGLPYTTKSRRVSRSLQKDFHKIHQYIADNVIAGGSITGEELQQATGVSRNAIIRSLRGLHGLLGVKMHADTSFGPYTSRFARPPFGAAWQKKIRRFYDDFITYGEDTSKMYYVSAKIPTGINLYQRWSADGWGVDKLPAATEPELVFELKPNPADAKPLNELLEESIPNMLADMKSHGIELSVEDGDLLVSYSSELWWDQYREWTTKNKAKLLDHFARPVTKLKQRHVVPSAPEADLYPVVIPASAKDTGIVIRFEE